MEFDSDIASLLQFVTNSGGFSRVGRIVQSLSSADPTGALVELNDYLNLAPEDGIFGFPTSQALNSLLILIQAAADAPANAVMAAQCLASAVDVVQDVAAQLGGDAQALQLLIENFTGNFDLSEQILRVFVRLVSRGNGAALVESEIFSGVCGSLVFFDFHTQISVLNAMRDAVAQTPPKSPQILRELAQLLVDDSLAPHCVAAVLEIFTRLDGKMLADEISDLLEDQISDHEQVVVQLLVKIASVSGLHARKFRASEKIGNLLQSHPALAVTLLPEFSVDDRGIFQVTTKTGNCRKFVAKLAAEISDLKIFLLQKLLNGAVSAAAASLATDAFVGEVIAGVSGRGWMRSETLLHALGLLIDQPSSRLVADGVAAAAKALLGRLGKSRKFPKFSEHLPIRALCDRILRACASVESKTATGGISDLHQFTVHEILASETMVESCLAEVDSDCAPSVLAEAIAVVQQCVARAQHAVVESGTSLVPKISKTGDLLLRVRIGDITVATDPTTPLKALAEEISDQLGQGQYFSSPDGHRLPDDMALIDAVMKTSTKRKFETISDLIVLDDLKAVASLPLQAPTENSKFWQSVHSLNVAEDQSESDSESDRNGQSVSRLTISDSLLKLVQLWRRLVGKARSSSQLLPTLVIPELSRKIGNPPNFPSADLDYLMAEIPFAFDVGVRKQALLGVPSAVAGRQRLTVSRVHAISETLHAFESGALRRDTTLEIGFRGEAGSGSGPANEFYALVAEELRNKSGFFRSVTQLYPSSELPKSVELWRLLGWLCGRALIDGRVTDFDFHPMFWATMRSEISRNFRLELHKLDPQYAQSLEKLLLMGPAELAALDLVFEAEEDEAAVPVAVSVDNVGSFVETLAEKSVSLGVAEKREAFREGLNEANVDVTKLLSLFDDQEISDLFCGSCRAMEQWTRQLLASEISPSHGYSKNSRVVEELVDVLCELNSAARREFIRFVTGARSLPAGGLAKLRPQLTVVKAVVQGDADDFLPSVMTCAHFLKLPEYSSKSILKQQLLKAITEGQDAFHLS